jgi:hypothetical protein
VYNQRFVAGVSVNILYIPFTVDEAMFDLYLKAQKWQEVYQALNKEVPIIIHHGSVKPEHIVKIEEAIKSSQCKVYVLSHGIDTEEMAVANQANILFEGIMDFDEEIKILPIEEVARRFQQDLMLPGFEAKSKVRLYFCDAFDRNKKAQKMAQLFKDTLDEQKQTTAIQYYANVSIARPSTKKDNLGVKTAVRIITADNPLISLTLLCKAGTVKQFRHELGTPPLIGPFFAKPEKGLATISFDEFKHPLVKQFAQLLVEKISSDDYLIGTKASIIYELLSILPKELDDYQLGTIELNCPNFHLKLDIKRTPKEFQQMNTVPKIPEDGVLKLI